jgi:hypothetical protein
MSYACGQSPSTGFGPESDAGSSGASSGSGGSGSGSGGSSGTGSGSGSSSGAGSSSGGSSSSAGSGGDGGTVSSGPSVLQHHMNPTRDGVYTDASMTKAFAATLKLSTTFAPTITGNVYAQPLYVTNGPGGNEAFIVVTE